MKKIIVLLILGVCLAVGCTSTMTKNNGGEKENGIVVLDVKNPGGDPIKFRDLVDSVRIVVLDESVEKALISYIGNIHKYGGRIIVEDHSSDYPVKFFDDNGKFVNAIRRGQGPGEVDNFGASYYNVDTKEFVFYNGLSLSFFDNDGNFKSKVDCQVPCNKITCLNGDYLFYSHPFYFSSISDYFFAVADKNFKIKYQACPYAKSDKYNGLSDGWDSKTFRNYGDRVEFQANDTIFSYDGKTLTPIINVKYERRRDEKDHISTFLFYVSNGKTQILHVHNMIVDERYVIVRDAESGHYFISPDTDDDYLDSDIYSWTHALEDGDMCVSLDCEDMADIIEDTPEFINRLTPEQQKVLKTDEDAHWLVFFKFKDF